MLVVALPEAWNWVLGVGVVAPLGTAFSAEQASLLLRHVEAVTLNFDGDQAGQKAVNAALPYLPAAELPTRVANTDGDPDTFIRKHGGDGRSRRFL